MSNVISLEQKRIEKSPHVFGHVQCMNKECRHAWEAVAPLQTDEPLQCPQCELMRGAWAYNFEHEGVRFECHDCKSQYFVVGVQNITCIGCGRGTTFKQLAEISG